MTKRSPNIGEKKDKWAPSKITGKRRCNEAIVGSSLNLPASY